MASDAKDSPRGIAEDPLAADETLLYGSGNGRRAGGNSRTELELSGEFGRYQVLKRLGEGGMGAVFLAHDSQFDHKVALKIPRFASADDQQTIERFYREARAAIKLHHSNICPVYDVGEIAGQHYLAMAYIEGRPLSAFINPARPLPERQVARLVHKVALALQEAHQNGIVHRDLKPSNIMFDEKRKEPIVMDFGLAARVGSSESRLTQAGTLIGSPAYMSPEQVRNDAEGVGPSSDIYSLGVILYELLTGRVPFEGPTAVVLGMIALKDPEPPSKLRAGIDPRLEAICLKAIAKNVDERYGSMRDLAKALAGYLNTQSTGGTDSRPLTVAQGGLAPTVELPTAEVPAADVQPVAATRKPVATTRKMEVTGLPRRTRKPAPRPNRKFPWLAAGGLAALSTIVGLLYFFLSRPGPTAVDPPAAPPASQAVVAATAAPSLPEEPPAQRDDERRPEPPPDRAPFEPVQEAEPVPPRREGPLRPGEEFANFDGADRNGDGVLAPDEYPLHIIVRGDVNRDQSLTRVEFEAAQRRLGPAFFGPPSDAEQQALPRPGPGGMGPGPGGPGPGGPRPGGPGRPGPRPNRPGA